MSGVGKLYKSLCSLLGILGMGAVYPIGEEAASIEGPDPGPKGSETYQPPQLKRPVSLLVPIGIRHLSHAWESAILRIRIGPEGRVADWIPLYLPHRKLLPAVGRALEGAEFTPPMVAGEPSMVDVSATLPLWNVGQFEVLSVSVSEDLESRMASLTLPANHLVLSMPGELDEPLAIIERGKVYSAVDEDGNELSWRVTMEFYVDPEGKVRMPRPVEAVDPLIAEVAMRTVRGFRFTAPETNGRPTVVKAQMELVADKE
ncbi:MAG: hypothetical protein GVY10_05960 [Verrucomicrobia bacterium]|jgi:hypothetical protein|nr:hypothetical protein [Verrucomicrobiota bacterium]